MRNIFSILVIIQLAASCLGCQDASAQTGQSNTPQKIDVPGDANKIESLLKNLRETTSAIYSFQCKIEYNYKQPLLDSQTLRNGNMYYQKNTGKSSLRINFDTIKHDDDLPQAYIEQYLFDGVWLHLIDYQLKEVKKYQQAEANSPIDAFELVKKNFPIIGFTNIDELKNDFEIAQKDAEQGKYYLQLKTKPQSQYAEKYTSIDFWINAKLNIPEKIVAAEKQGDIYEISFVEPQINKNIEKKIFEIQIPKGFTQSEVVPLQKK